MAETVSADAAPASATNASARRRWLLILTVVLIAAALIYLVFFVLLAKPSEETGDAYVAGDIVSVTARDSGVILALNADSTEVVRAGQPLIDLDPARADVGLAAENPERHRPVRRHLLPVSHDHALLDPGRRQRLVGERPGRRARLPVHEAEPPTSQVGHSLHPPRIAGPDQEPQLPTERVHDHGRAPR